MRHIWLGPNYLVYILDNYEHLDIRITKHLRVLRLNEREIQHRIVLYGCVFLGELLPNILSLVLIKKIYLLLQLVVSYIDHKSYIDQFSSPS